MASEKQEIKNPKANPGPEKQWNDHDMIMDVLTSVKGLMNIYHTFASEASNNELYNKIHTLYNELSTLQRTLFDMMFEKGWYVLETTPQNKIQKKVKQFTQLGNQL